MKPHINKLLDAVSQYNREIRTAFYHSETREDLSNNYGTAIANLKSNLASLKLENHFEWDAEDSDIYLRSNEPRHIGDTDPFKDEN